MISVTRTIARGSLSALLAIGCARCVTRAPLGRPVATPRPASARETVPSPSSVRAELASVLLNAGRYAEAAAEYQRLVEIDGRHSGYRLGLARALAWGRRYHEAERQLRLLAAWQPLDAAVDTLLRSVRANITPTAREATAWYAERPSYAPYRRALARALVREGRARSALGHYHWLLAAEPTTALLRETAAAHLAAHDPAGGIAVIERQRARIPWDSETRRVLAMLLAADARFTAALAHNDTVQFNTRDPAVLVERARIDIMRGDYAAAEADLRASLAIAPTADAYRILGDVHRWQAEFAEARVAYDGARIMSPGDPAVVAAIAQLARAERPAPIGLPVADGTAEWRMSAAALHDNAGVDYLRLGARRSFELQFGLIGGAGVEYRALSERTALDDLASNGFAVDVSLARSVTHGALMASIAGRVGAVYHPGDALMTTRAVAMHGGYQAWIAALEVAAGPAYPMLLTAASLLSGDAAPLRERRTTVSAGGPVGLADAAFTWHRAALTDGNHRSSLNLAVRYPLARHFTAVYAGARISYAERSQLYWDPDGYLSSAIGIDYANRRTRGVSLATQALLGVARTESTPFLRAPIGDDSPTSARLQLNLASEIAYRREQWDAAVAFAFGRVSRYERGDITVSVRIAP